MTLPATLSVVRPTATPEPGGKIVVITPGATDSGWWASGGAQGILPSDSFLYSGYFDDEVFLSAVRLDLRQVPRGAPIRSATLELTGLREDRLDPAVENAKWTVQILDTEEIKDFARSDFQALYNAPAAVTLFPTLAAKDLGVRRVNTLTFDATALNWLSSQVLDGATSIIVRLRGPDAAPPSLFAWDGGSGKMTAGTGPRARSEPRGAASHATALTYTTHPGRDFEADSSQYTHRRSQRADRYCCRTRRQLLRRPSSLSSQRHPNNDR